MIHFTHDINVLLTNFLHRDMEQTEGKREDKRTPSQLRPIDTEQGLLNRADGSAKYSQGIWGLHKYQTCKGEGGLISLIREEARVKESCARSLIFAHFASY